MVSQVHFRMDDNEKRAFEVDDIPFETLQPIPQLAAVIKSQDYIEFNHPEEGLAWLND